MLEGESGVRVMGKVVRYASNWMGSQSSVSRFTRTAVWVSEKEGTHTSRTCSVGPATAKGEKRWEEGEEVVGV